MFELNRKWALFLNDEIISILSTTPLQFGWGRGVGIAGVATRSSHRGQGYASQLLNQVHIVSTQNGEGAIYLFATRPEIYSRIGYQILDEAVRGEINARPRPGQSRQLTMQEIRVIYDRWACENPNRLIRDERRWRLWQWNLKFCASFQGGYLAVEGPSVREAIFAPETMESWPVPSGATWFGLKSMTETLGVPLKNMQSELHLMGFQTDRIPEMFLTDQF